MLIAKTISLRATVINARTAREADESARGNEENLALEALMNRSGLVGEVLVLQVRIAAKGGGGLVQGVRGDRILGANGDLDLEPSLGDTTVEAGVIEAFQGVADQNHPIVPDPEEDPGDQGIVTRMSHSENEITQCWTTSRSKTPCYPHQELKPRSKKRTT